MNNSQIKSEAQEEYDAPAPFAPAREILQAAKLAELEARGSILSGDNDDIQRSLTEPVESKPDAFYEPAKISWTPLIDKEEKQSQKEYGFSFNSKKVN